jgi:putative transposase
MGLSEKRPAVVHPPGKPNENAYIESFNGKFRDECLNEHWFISLAHARSVIEAWRIEYNTERPHGSLGNLTPQEFATSRANQTEERASLPADSNAISD